MSRADGSILIAVDVDTGNAEKGFSRVKSQMLDISGAVSKVGKMIASAFAIREIVRFGSECIELGSNVAEVQNVVDVAFGDMSHKVEAFAKSAIENFGMSQLAAKKTASTYMAMAKGMGIADGTASDMAITLAGLTGDVASFYNISQELADIKLKSVFTGETETLKDLGIVMTQDNLAAYALSRGIEKSIDSMTQSEKVALRYHFVLDSLALATGDFARTADSWANQTRILSMQWQEFMSIIGQSLTTILTPLVKILNSVVSSLINIANTANAVISRLFGGANTQLSRTQQNAEMISGAIGDSVDNQNTLTDATKETAKAQKGVLAGFDEINQLAAESAGTETGNGSSGSSVAITPEINTDSITESTEEVAGILSGIAEAVQPSIDALQRLWDVLQPIGSFAGDAFVDFYETALKPIGAWVLGEGIPRFVDAVSKGLALVDWQKINDALHNLWTALTPFAVNVGEGLLWLWENALVPLGTWVMNEAVPLFLDGIAAALEFFNAVWEAAQPALVWLFENFLKPVAEWTGGVIITVLEDLVKLIGDLTEVLTGQKTMSEFFGDLTPLEIGLMGVGAGLTTVALGMAAVAAVKGVTEAFNAISTFVKNAQALKATSLFGKLAEVFVLASSGGKTLAESMKLVFGPGSIIAGIAALVAGAVTAVSSFLSMLENGFSWANEALMALGIAIAAVGATILGAPGVVAAAVAAVVAAVATLVVYIKEHWEGVKKFLSALWDGIKRMAVQFWNDTTQPVYDCIESIKANWERFKVFLSALWAAIKVTASDFWNTIRQFATDCWEKIKSTFSVAANWVTNNVTQPIKNGFKSFVNGLIGYVESFVNFFVRGINRVVEAANSLKFTVPDWVPAIGGSTFGLNLKKMTEISLPRLATGTVVPPNREFMAILGDNKTETEVVSPLSTMKQAMLEAMQESGFGGEITITVVTNLDGKEVARNSVRHINNMTVQAGKSPLLI